MMMMMMIDDGMGYNILNSVPVLQPGVCSELCSLVSVVEYVAWCLQ